MCASCSVRPDTEVRTAPSRAPQRASAIFCGDPPSVRVRVAAAAAGMPTTLLTTPGQMDRNVAKAWTLWLLREDDSPQSILDAIMNGLSLGCVCGGAVDASYAMLRRLRFSSSNEGAFSWTRRGAALGGLISVAFYCTLRVYNNVAPENASASAAPPSELIQDPWAARKT